MSDQWISVYKWQNNNELSAERGVLCRKVIGRKAKLRLLRIFIRSEMIGDKVLNEDIVELIFIVDNVPGGMFAFAEMVSVSAELLVLLIGAASVVNGFVESVAFF